MPGPVRVPLRWTALMRQMAMKAVPELKVWRTSGALPEAYRGLGNLDTPKAMSVDKAVWLPKTMTVSPLGVETLQRRLGIDADAPGFGDAVVGHEVGHLVNLFRVGFGLPPEATKQLDQMRQRTFDRLTSGPEPEAYNAIAAHTYEPWEAASDVSGLLFAHRLADLETGQPSLLPTADLRRLALMQVLEGRQAMQPFLALHQRTHGSRTAQELRQNLGQLLDPEQRRLPWREE